MRLQRGEADKQLCSVSYLNGRNIRLIVGMGVLRGVNIISHNMDFPNPNKRLQMQNPENLRFKIDCALRSIAIKIVI